MWATHIPHVATCGHIFGRRSITVEMQFTFLPNDLNGYYDDGRFSAYNRSQDHLNSGVRDSRVRSSFDLHAVISYA